jgi:hypothetical protein
MVEANVELTERRSQRSCSLRRLGFLRSAKDYACADDRGDARDDGGCRKRDRCSLGAPSGERDQE